MPMIASSCGYEPTLEVHIDTLVVTSSLNDIELVTSESCRVRPFFPVHIIIPFDAYSALRYGAKLPSR